MSYERVVVIGHIGSAKVEMSKCQNPYFKMSVAATRGMGEDKKTIWYSVLMFGPLVKDAAKLEQLFRKGRQVIVEGRPQFEAYLRNDGKPEMDNTIYAITMPTLLDNPNKNSNG
ncbi:single-stranded DNA-binding protein [Nostoc sp. CHAB 5834]|nr:single-stranded DNA-binding protein [Nostoc sp. CHAB 5834]